MLTGRAAELRPDVNYLQPNAVFVPYPDQPPREYGSNEQILRDQARAANIRCTQAKAARPRKPGAIPTSGRARSDAKRNQRAHAATWWRGITAEVAEGWTAVRGKQYEHDAVAA